VSAHGGCRDGRHKNVQPVTVCNTHAYACKCLCPSSLLHVQDDSSSRRSMPASAFARVGLIRRGGIFTSCFKFKPYMSRSMSYPTLLYLSGKATFDRRASVRIGLISAISYRNILGPFAGRCQVLKIGGKTPSNLNAKFVLCEETRAHIN
jgi:hypothetical protein